MTRVGLTVFKNAEGQWRWAMLSSNAFEDRDGEVISQKALEEDVARADADGDYGPLRWWHVPGLDIGTCDFNAMEGRILVEAGGFVNEQLGEIIAAKANDLSGSISFFHPDTEPDEEGVYHSIRRFERSLLPKEAASNPFVQLVVEQEETPMKKAKIEEFKKKLGLGADGKLVESVIDMAEKAEATAIDQGVRTKEAEVAPEVTPEVVPAETAAPPAEVTKQVDLTARIEAVRSAINALTPPFANGPWTWADTVFDDHVIAVREEKSWSIPYTWDDATKTVALAPFDQWTAVERVWQPVAAAAKAVSAETPVETPAEPLVATVKADVAAPAVAPEDQPISGMTMGDLVKLIIDVVGKIEAPVAPEVAAGKQIAEKAAQDLTQFIEGQKTAAAETAKTLKDLAGKVEVLLGEAPRSVARAARASQEDASLVQNQSDEVKQRLADKGGKPAPDSWLDKFVGGIQAATGAAGESPLVLGGPGKQGGA